MKMNNPRDCRNGGETTVRDYRFAQSTINQEHDKGIKFSVLYDLFFCCSRGRSLPTGPLQSKMYFELQHFFVRWSL